MRNVKNVDGLGLPSYPRVSVESAHPHRLAVVGGGSSLSHHVGTLRTWPGDIWAINGAWQWCVKNGIEATFLACDPDPIVMRWAEGGVRKALLGNTCPPGVFEMLKKADVKIWECDGEAGAIAGRGSTATCVPHLAARMGHLEGVTFFGCESCYVPGQTHAYFHEGWRLDELLIECGGNEYLTAPDFYIQAIELSRIIRELPGYLDERSGGLLRAMIATPEFHVRWISENYAKQITEREHSAAA